jgi:hypothetical protein
MNKKIKSNNRKIIDIGYMNGKSIQQFVVTLPTFMLKSNITEFDKYWSLEMPLCCDKQHRIKKIVKKLKDIDNKIIEDAKFYGNDWFNDLSDIKYKSIIRKKQSDDPIYDNGILKIKILKPEACKNADLKTVIIKDMKSKGTIDDLTLNSDCKIVLLFHSLVFNGN